jgi:phosphonopyruvate decarboxylase
LLCKSQKKHSCYRRRWGSSHAYGCYSCNRCKKLKNFRHIVINNGAHDSVGGQPTIAQRVNLCDIALACGYKYARRVESREKFLNVLSEQKESPAFIEVFVKKGARKDLGRPKISPVDNKLALMKNFVRIDKNVNI